MGFTIGKILRIGSLNDIHYLFCCECNVKLAIANSFLLTAKHANLPFSSASSITFTSFSGKWRSLSSLRMFLMRTIVTYAENVFENLEGSGFGHQRLEFSHLNWINHRPFFLLQIIEKLLFHNLSSF
jgi:hypothetical protein